ncbi:hypothetical protein N9C96_02470 [bacterium]|nr:hypothetical protein [bacterium]
MIAFICLAVNLGHKEDRLMRKVLIYGDSNSFGTAPTPRLGDECVHAPGVRWGDVAAVALGDSWQIITEGLPGRTAVLDDPVEGAYKNGLTVARHRDVAPSD